MNNKKYLIILILKLLETETDIDKPLTQTKIAEIISERFPCDRKTVCRNIGFLIKVGYPIRKTNKGYYLDNKKFTVDEAKFILNAVRNSSLKTEMEKKVLANRLEDILYKIYR
jgi:transcriptional regulator of NAD metabolism